MITITTNQVESEVKAVNAVLEGKRNMDKDVCAKLEELGFELHELGTGKSAKTGSKQIKVQDIKSDWMNQGTYLVVGICNKAYGKGNIYRGYVKEIK